MAAENDWAICHPLKLRHHEGLLRPGLQADSALNQDLYQSLGRLPAEPGIRQQTWNGQNTGSKYYFRRIKTIYQNKPVIIFRKLLRYGNHKDAKNIQVLFKTFSDTSGKLFS
ncbi:hypothetical protein AVEN_243115-1 [Araneus ventricosus]|uniref:Uncharacterized protein n=1 Tax=Araneus ventricosus TaxID=182803 RepID=A0A4Y2VEC8_ARAVE|nr:hypothetical protein AVEN_243115-1 [Araneus ventricosus]